MQNLFKIAQQYFFYLKIMFFYDFLISVILNTPFSNGHNLWVLSYDAQGSTREALQMD